MAREWAGHSVLAAGARVPASERERACGRRAVVQAIVRAGRRAPVDVPQTASVGRWRRQEHVKPRRQACLLGREITASAKPPQGEICRKRR